jgi:M6 family metalloprotease-like protein
MLRRLLPLGVAFTAGLLLQAADPAAPDLSEFRSPENALTTRVSSAAPPDKPVQPAYLGVNLDADAQGRAVVAQVEPDSPAAKAGLREGDVLREIDGKTMDVAAVRTLLHTKAPGDALKLVVARQDKEEALTATLAAVSRPLTPGQRAIIGVQMAQGEAEGARIDQIFPGKPAADAGLKPGDLILRVDDDLVHNPDQLATALADHKPGDVVGLTFRRGHVAFGVLTKLAADDSRRPRGWNDNQPAFITKDVYRLAVVPIEFSDVEHNAKIALKDWEKALFSKGEYANESATGQKVYGSLNDFFLEQSCGAFHVEGKVFDWVKVEKKRAEYGGDGARFALFNEALDKVEARDGKEAFKGFDGVFFLYAGGRVQTQRGGLYWPHKANFRRESKNWNYFICPEGGDRMASISVVAHEFGHMLGLPDLYAQGDGSVGLGIWCTMSTGHGQDGKPLHFSAWCKEQLGWIKPAVIDPTVKQKLILSPIEGASKECFKVLIKQDGSEYLLLENRVKKDFDRDLPGEGLLIWRVADGRPILEESHGIVTPDGPNRFLGSIPYPSKSNNAFTPDTTPSSKSPSGGLPVNITNIRRLPDGRITFFIGYEYL